MDNPRTITSESLRGKQLEGIYLQIRNILLIRAQRIETKYETRGFRLNAKHFVSWCLDVFRRVFKMTRDELLSEMRSIECIEAARLIVDESLAVNVKNYITVIGWINCAQKEIDAAVKVGLYLNEY